MNQFLRDRILRKLDTISDERAYQVLDFVEYLESKYAERQSPSTNVLQRFAETVEDKLRAAQRKLGHVTIHRPTGVLQHRVGIRREIDIALKQFDRRDRLGDLKKPAGSANNQVQWKSRLRFVQILKAQKIVGERLETKIENGLAAPRAAGAAGHFHRRLHERKWHAASKS